MNACPPGRCLLIGPLLECARHVDRAGCRGPSDSTTRPFVTGVPDLSPGTRYDTRIPTLTQVAGHALGDEISTPEQIESYLKALQTAAPDRARLVEYGRTWEGRPLYILIVGSPERMARLDEIKAGMKRLADPRGCRLPRRIAWLGRSRSSSG